MGAIVGGLSGLIVLMMTYLGTRESKPARAPIQEVRMSGLVGSTEKTSSPGMLYPGLNMQPLLRSDYLVIGPTRGTGCAHYVALWPLPIFWVKREGGALKWFNADPQSVAEQAAWYQAIDSQPRADVMLSPRTHAKEDNRYALWYRRDCVSISGKALEIKLDAKTEK